jgi:alpha-ketoglutarate-dependent taurine dioxygenase
MVGRFVESAADRHVALRERTLRRLRWFPAPTGVEAIPARADESQGYIAKARTALDARGVALLQLDRALSNSELISLSETFGTPLSQPNPRTQPWVEDHVILNLRADHSETDDHAWGLLFAENYVMLHTELAARPATSQPRHILLQCIEPPPPNGGGQTVLVAMDRVRRSLGDRQAAILQETRHVEHPTAPPFLRREGRRDIFSFKDVHKGGIAWRYDGGDPSVVSGDLDDALRKLLLALYDPVGVTGIWWKRSTLAIIDNQRFLHGRTFAPRGADRPPRHLRRVRVSSSPALASVGPINP